MGVIHKLKEEVVAFIIQQKKDHPNLGCRQLASIVNEKFQIRVSKSSINTIMKDALLSSSVGRRPSPDSKSKKFQIPFQKKKQLFEEIQKADLQHKTKAHTPPVEKEETVKEPPLRQEEERHTIDVREEELLPLMPDPLESEIEIPESQFELSKELIDLDREAADQVIEAAPTEIHDTIKEEKSGISKEDFLKHVNILRAQKASHKGPLCEGMGFVFLKAAEMEVSQPNILGDLFRKYVKGHLPSNFDALCEGLLFLKLLGVQSPQEAGRYQSHGLWILNNITNGQDNRIPTDSGSDKKPSIQALYDWTEAIEVTPTLFMEYINEREQAFLEISGSKLFLEDGTVLSIDAQISTIWSEKPAPERREVHDRWTAELFCPLNKAITLLSHTLISNNQSTIFCMSPGISQFYPEFYEMVAVFENLPGKGIKQITLLDHNGDDIATYTTIPVTKRGFMVGVWPGQKEFAELTKSVKWAAKRHFYHTGVDMIVYYTDTKSDYVNIQMEAEVGEFRVITLWECEKDTPLEKPTLAILTNKNNMEAEDIIGAYIDRWPYFQMRAESNPLKNLDLQTDKQISPVNLRKGEIDNIGEMTNFWEIFDDFGNQLHRHSLRHYFPRDLNKKSVSDLIKDVYGLFGHLREAKESLHITLIPPASYPYRQALAYAVEHVNQRQIMDNSGRRLLIHIDSV